MKKLIFGAALLASSVIATDAGATERSFPYWYLGLSGGLADQNDSDVDSSATDINWDTGYIVSASIGYQPKGFGGFRPEVEYSYRYQEFSNDGEINVNVLAANLYYDLYNSSQFTPFIGGGLGYGHFDIDGPGLGDSDYQPIYQGMVGVAYEPVSVHNVALNLGYRYMAPFSDPDAGGGDYEYDNHSIELGAKFRF